MITAQNFNISKTRHRVLRFRIWAPPSGRAFTPALRYASCIRSIPVAGCCNATGFTHNVATRLAHNKSGSLQLNFIETLCLILNCEPNDLFYWEPDAKVSVGENHSLNKLRKTPNTDNVNSIAQLSYKQLLKLSEKIEEIKKEVVE